MSNYTWDTTFTELFERCLAKYKTGDEDYANYYTDEDLAFLKSIGYKKREFFDFIEDFGDDAEPSITSALMIASVRRDFLKVVMNGKLSDFEIKPSDLPPKDAHLGGVVWLPRIITKAQGKLRGELNPEIMFSCGGDRNFLRTHDIAPADFLRAVWAAGHDDEKILKYVKG